MLVLTKLTISGSGFDGLRIGSTSARRACCAQPLDVRPRRRGFDAIAQRPLDLRGLGAQLPVRRLEFLRLAIGAQRLFELAGVFELPAALGVHRRRGDHRAFERDLVVGAIGIVLERLPVEADRRFPVAGLAGRLAARERAARGAASRHHGRRAPRIDHGFHDATDHRILCPSYCPVSLITCRPRPSAYVISIDSVPIFTIGTGHR